jgi:hypothetical protein
MINPFFQSPRYYPIAMEDWQQHPIRYSWHQKNYSWQNWLQPEQETEQEEYELETERLRYFGGVPGEEVSLLEPMLQVVTYLFDGNTDYEDP